MQVQFNSRGTKILTASVDRTAKVWDNKTGDCKQTLEGHTDEVFCASFNYEGDILITGKCGKKLKCLLLFFFQNKLTLS